MTKSTEIITFARANKNIIRNSHGLSNGRVPIYFKAFTWHEFKSMVLLALEKPCDFNYFTSYQSLEKLEQLINKPNYKTHQLKKKSGGTRIISVPEENLLRIQRNLNYTLQHYYKVVGSADAYGFIKGKKNGTDEKSIFTNAQKHIGKKVVMSLDIKDFFNSISSGRVYELFKSDLFDFSDEIATALTLLTTYERHLPTGAPTSPIVSNFICIQLDQELGTFAARHKLTYSRYADDLTFSSNAIITEPMKKELVEIITNNKFSVNDKKWRIRTNSQQQIVTGLVVNQKVNLDRRSIKKVRAILHDLDKNGIEKATANHFKIDLKSAHEFTDKFINRLNGLVDFIGQIRGREDKIYLRIKGKLELVYLQK